MIKTDILYDQIYNCANKELVLTSRRVVKLSQTLVSFPSNIILPSWDTVLGIVDSNNTKNKKKK